MRGDCVVTAWWGGVLHCVVEWYPAAWWGGARQSRGWGGVLQSRACVMGWWVPVRAGEFAGKVRCPAEFDV